MESIRNQKTQQIIDARLTRVQRGLLGDSRFLGAGVGELKVDFGPGYRIYFGLDGPTMVVLLLGGAKSTQDKDIRQARAYWEDYRNRIKK